jgi:hypothetical protein
MTAFGYFVVHNGDLAGWRAQLAGAQEIRPNFFKIAVPNKSEKTITTTIEARPHTTGIPWWVWVIIALLLLILLWWLFSRR